MSEKINRLLQGLKNDLRISTEVISGLRANEKYLRIIESDDEIMRHLHHMISNTESITILFTPQIIPEVLQEFTRKAYEEKANKFMWITKIDFDKYDSKVLKILAFRNIQFRNLKKECNYYSCARDAKEFLIGKQEEKSTESISILYEQENIVNEMGTGPFFGFFLKNSTPVYKGMKSFKRARLKAKLNKKLEKIQDPEKREKLFKKHGFQESELIEDFFP